MKTIIIFFSLITSNVILSQDLSVTIEADKNEYSRNDSISLTYKIRNTGTKPVIVKMTDSFELKKVYNSSGNSSFCFSVYQTGAYGDNRITKDDFTEIMPGDEIQKTGYFTLGWRCRNAPPRGNLELEISYERLVTSEDNYYLFESYYSGNYEKIFVDAWTGEMKSNTIKISVLD